MLLRFALICDFFETKDPKMQVIQYMSLFSEYKQVRQSIDELKSYLMKVEEEAM